MAFQHKNITMGENNQQLLNEFLIYLSQNKAPNSINTYRSALHRIRHLDWLACTSTDLIAWRNDYSKKVCDNTLQNRLILINVFFEYLKKTNKRQDIPTELLELPRIEVGNTEECKLISNEIYQELYEDCGVPLILKVAISLGHTMGFRISEIVDLDVKYINFEERYITVRMSKGNKSRRVPLTSVAHKFIKQYIDWYGITEGLLLRNRNGKPMTTDTLRKRFNDIKKKYGIDEEITFHKNRHQYISTLINNPNVSLIAVMDNAGHSNPSTTQKYIHVNHEEKQKQTLGVFDSMFETK